MNQREANAHMARWAIATLLGSSGADDEIHNDYDGPRSPEDQERLRRAMDRVYRALRKMSGQATQPPTATPLFYQYEEGGR